MNLASGLLLVGMGAAYSGKVDFAQSNIMNRAPQQLSSTVQNHSANSALQLRSGAYSNSPAVVILKQGKLVGAACVLKRPGTNAPALSFVVTNAPIVLKPGVYKIEPYAGTVIVPDSHPDDGAIVRLAEDDLAMPIIKPDLRFIPLKPASK